MCARMAISKQDCGADRLPTPPETFSSLAAHRRLAANCLYLRVSLFRVELIFFIFALFLLAIHLLSVSHQSLLTDGSAKLEKRARFASFRQCFQKYVAANCLCLGASLFQIKLIFSFLPFLYLPFIYFKCLINRFLTERCKTQRKVNSFLLGNAPKETST